MPPRISSAFIPVTDPEAAAQWYTEKVGFEVVSADSFSAVLATSTDTKLTLMGLQSGISAEPGLSWASCGFLADDLEGTRRSLAFAGVEVGAVEGDPGVCLFFTAKDLDGNTLLFTDR